MYPLASIHFHPTRVLADEALWLRAGDRPNRVVATRVSSSKRARALIMKANSIVEAVGNTLHIHTAKLFADAEGVKSERSNPGGSIKDRIGLAMIEATEKDGNLEAGGVARCAPIDRKAKLFAAQMFGR